MGRDSERHWGRDALSAICCFGIVVTTRGKGLLYEEKSAHGVARKGDSEHWLYGVPGVLEGLSRSLVHNEGRGLSNICVEGVVHVYV